MKRPSDAHVMRKEVTMLIKVYNSVKFGVIVEISQKKKDRFVEMLWMKRVNMEN